MLSKVTNLLQMLQMLTRCLSHRTLTPPKIFRLHLCGLQIWLQQITPFPESEVGTSHVLMENLGILCGLQIWLHQIPSPTAPRTQNFSWRNWALCVDFRFGYIKSPPPPPRIGTQTFCVEFRYLAA